MSIRQLTLTDLEHLDDGKAVAEFNGHIRRIAQDCRDRPGDPKARVVTLQLSCTPVIAPDGSCDEVKARLKIKSSVPDHVTREYSFGLRANGAFIFSEDSPTNINQATFDMGEDD